MSTTNVEFPALNEDAKVPAYFAKPEGGAKKAIIVLPEIFGVNAGVRKKVDDWAALGYLAVAPDLFWRYAPGVELNPDVETEFQEALGYFGQYDADKGVYDIEASIRWLREQGAEKIGTVGFCLGGRLAYMAATRTDIDAAVGYYGVMIDQMLDEAKAISNPLMLHVPTEDHFVDHAAQKKIHEALDTHEKVTIHDYQGLDHGFASTFGTRRDDAGAELADERTLNFFAEHLG